MWCFLLRNKIRSFISVDISDPVIAKKVEDIEKKLMGVKAAVKWVDPKVVHITLKFLGDISPAQIDPIFEVMKDVGFKPFNIHILNIGCFPNMNKPRVVWLGIKEGKEELEALYSQLNIKLKPLGFRPETRRFRAHITIGRIKGKKGIHELAGQISRMKEVAIGIQRIESLKLKKSTLTPKGPIYETLREVSP